MLLNESPKIVRLYDELSIGLIFRVVPFGELNVDLSIVIGMTGIAIVPGVEANHHARIEVRHVGLHSPRVQPVTEAFEWAIDN